MEKPTVNSFSTVAPLIIQQYERYLPTAFDESLTILEKVNKVIQTLEQMGKLTNDVVTQWNTVMEWVLNDGITEDVNTRLDEMTADGTMDQIINQNIFGDLNTKVNTNTSSISTLDTRITDEVETINQTISTYQTDNDALVQNTKTELEGKLDKKGFKFYGSPEEYGAVGDGVTDDTIALQECFNENALSNLSPFAKYKVNKTLKLPRNHSINGNNAMILVDGSWNTTINGATVPNNTVLWIEAREAIFMSELEMKTRFIKDLRIEGDESFDLTGIYMGTENRGVITQPSSVNYSVADFSFQNLSIAKCFNGVHLGEVWGSSFHAIQTSYIRNIGLLIKGQCVNNTFTSCHFSTGGSGKWGVSIDGETYNGTVKRPEGLTFNGGFIGYAENGLEGIRGLAINFNNMIIDLNTNYGVILTDASFWTFTDCWIHADTYTVFSMNDISTIENSTNVSLKGCKLVPIASNRSVYIGQRQNGVIIDGCFVKNLIEFSSATGGSIINNLFSDAETTDQKIRIGTTSNVTTTNNRFKVGNNEVPVTRL